MDAPRHPLSIHHALCPADMPLLEFLDLLVRHGFTGIGLTAAALEAMPLEDLRAALQSRGLGVSSIDSAGYFFDREDGGRAQHERNIRLLNAAARLGAARLNVVLDDDDRLSGDRARDWAAEPMRDLRLQAEVRYVNLVVEPLARHGSGTRSCLNTLAQAKAFFRAVQGLALNLDLFQLWNDPDLMTVAYGRSIPVGLLQVCDIMVDQTTQTGRRTIPGQGSAPWQEVLLAARSIFRHIPVEVELSADDVEGMATDEVLAAIAQSVAGGTERAATQA